MVVFLTSFVVNQLFPLTELLNLSQKLLYRILPVVWFALELMISRITDPTKVFGGKHL